MKELFQGLFLLPVLIITLSCKNNPTQEEILEQELMPEQETGVKENSSIELEDLDGNAIDLEDYEGKIVFLNFWATWCKPCIAEMPSIDRLKNELGDTDYIFLAASDEKMEKIQKFVEKYPHDFKYVRLKTNVYELGLSVLPTTFIINRDGVIVDKVIGAKEWDSQEVIQQLKGIQNKS